ncbi:MAG: hypothetical protein ACT4P7_03910 [Gemmatimonadaceae bacterium]
MTAAVGLCLLVVGVAKAGIGGDPGASIAEAKAAVAVARIAVAPGADSLSALSEAVTRHDPFRASRRRSAVELLSGVEQVSGPPPVSRPVLRLVGIVGGPLWSALLEGIPGREGTVLVAAGDTLAGLRVRSVSASTAIVIGFDTTWTLDLRRVVP